MIIYNNSTHRWEFEDNLSIRGIVYINYDYIEFGFFNYNSNLIPLIFNGKLVYLDSYEHSEVPLYWRNSECCYTIDPLLIDNLILPSKQIFNYPINKSYNFCKLNLQPCSLKFPLELEEEFKYIKNFTFGLEYETSGGNIPWHTCLNLNLVPLYDGSIQGHEYVTFPLTFQDLSIIPEHLKLLQIYTKYDHNCSLHIHFGGFPIIFKSIEHLCKYWYYFQDILLNYIPILSYTVEEYKDNGKAYNKPWKYLIDLKKFYHKYTLNTYKTDQDFLLPNKYDAEEKRKWEVSGRYFNMNIMHLISGSDHKTVEFRFLRPTTNYSEIKWYILVLAAFLNYIIKTSSKQYKTITLNKVLMSTYPKNIVKNILNQGTKLYHLHKIQMTNSDYPGINQKLKETYLELTNFSM